MEGAGIATALSEERMGGFPSDPALFEEKHSQSKPVEVINKRQHVWNAGEIPSFCEKKNNPTDIK